MTEELRKTAAPAEPLYKDTFYSGVDSAGRAWAKRVSGESVRVRDLRAVSAPPAAPAEPVGVVSDLFPSLRRACNDRGIPDDALLYATPQPPAAPAEPLTDEQIDRMLSAKIPGGSQARDWFIPHDTERGLRNVRDVVRAMLNAAPAGLVGADPTDCGGDDLLWYYPAIDASQANGGE